MNSPSPPTPKLTQELNVLDECLGYLLGLIGPRGEGPTELFTAKSVFGRIFDGSGQGGESSCLWEITRWKHRATSEAGILSGQYADDDFLVWVSEDRGLNPNWQVYSEQRFRQRLRDACAGYAIPYPRLRHEIREAAASHGIHFQ